jgi:hypothetical protein
VTATGNSTFVTSGQATGSLHIEEVNAVTAQTESNDVTHRNCPSWGHDDAHELAGATISPEMD